MLWCYAIRIGKCSENKQIFITERHKLQFHEHQQFSNTMRHGFCTGPSPAWRPVVPGTRIWNLCPPFQVSHPGCCIHPIMLFRNVAPPSGSCSPCCWFCTDCQQSLLAAIQVPSCSFCATSMPTPRVFLAWTCVCFANNTFFSTSCFLRLDMFENNFWIVPKAASAQETSSNRAPRRRGPRASRMNLLTLKSSIETARSAQARGPQFLIAQVFFFVWPLPTKAKVKRADFWRR